MNRFEGLRIFLLEDEPIIAMALEDAIIDAGAIAILAGSLAKATTVATEAAIDFAILDVNIHGEQSYGVAAVLAERQIPFVFASGYGSMVHPEEFAAIPTVAKPYQISAIADALALLL